MQLWEIPYLGHGTNEGVGDWGNGGTGARENGKNGEVGEWINGKVRERKREGIDRLATRHMASAG